MIGGYGRLPVDPGIMSDEAREAAARSGPCLTLAEVPSVDESGRVTYELVKIFSPPVLHDREVIPWQIDMVVPKSPS